MWEIFSKGQSPYSQFQDNDLYGLLDFLNSGQRLSQPLDCTDKEFWSLILECWNKDKTSRTSLIKIIHYLGNSSVLQTKSKRVQVKVGESDESKYLKALTMDPSKQYSQILDLIQESQYPPALLLRYALTFVRFDVLTPSEKEELSSTSLASWFSSLKIPSDSIEESRRRIEYGYALFFIKRDFTSAVKIFQKESSPFQQQHSVIIGRYLLGICHQFGYGLTEDKKTAFELFESLSEFPPALFKVGTFYDSGAFVQTDKKEAVKWYRKAADQGHTDAQFSMGFCFRNGAGVEVSLEEAVKWYRKAADQGHARAQSHLGYCYFKGIGVEVSKEEGVKWYQKSADQGHAPAQYNLGLCYSSGTGVEMSKEEGVKWYRKAADQGHATAQFNLGCCYVNGIGVQVSKKEAVKWFRKAADQGDADAQFNLGRILTLT